MDPLSIATGSIALVSTITKVGISLTDFVREVRDARSDIDGVSAELNSLKTILELIVDDVEAAKSPLPPLLKTRIEAILSSCSQAVNDIDACVKCHQGSRVQKGLRWATIGRGDMSKLQSTLEANKATLSLALDMISITTLQEVKQSTENIQTTTTNIYQDTGDIKEDTARILQAIVELQARLLSEENPRYNVLQRYLDELSTYAESVIDDMDRNLDVDESSSEASTPRGPSPNSSFTALVEPEYNGQLLPQKALPPKNGPDVQKSINARPPRQSNPFQDRRSPPHVIEHQRSSTLENVQSTNIASDENASHTTQRQSFRDPDPTVHARGIHEPLNSPTSKADGKEPEKDRIRARAKQILQEPVEQKKQQEPETMTGTCVSIDNAQRLEEIIGIPILSLPRSQRGRIWVERGLGRGGRIPFPIPTALLDCAAHVESLWDNDTMFPHVLDYTFNKCLTSTPKTSDCDKGVIAAELLEVSRRAEVSANEVEVVFSIIAVLGYLDGLPDAIIPPACIVKPKASRIRLSNSISDKARRKAAKATLGNLPSSNIGILTVVLHMFMKCDASGISLRLTKKLLRSDEGSHWVFVEDLLTPSFNLFNYQLSP